MAYMTVRLSAGTYDQTTNSTYVSATVYMTWDTSQSYNQMNRTGTLIIGNNYNTTFSTNFNTSRTESGTQILGCGSTTIYHDSNGGSLQVTAWADGEGYSASDFITLPGGTPSGSSGSGSGGDSGSPGSGSGDSGDTGGGDSGSGGDTGGGNEGDPGDWSPPLGELCTCILEIDQGEHTTITVVHEKGDYRVGEILSDGDELPFIYGNSGYEIRVIVNVENGYSLSEFTSTLNADQDSTFKPDKDGVLYYYGTHITTNDGYHGFAKIKTRAIPSVYVYIDNKIEMAKYIPYISDGRKWDCYAPYIVYRDYCEGMFKATVRNSNGTSLMRDVGEGGGTKICTIPYGTDLIIEEIKTTGYGTYNGDTIFKTTYMSYSGWIYATDVDCEISGTIGNQAGAIVYKKDLSSGLVKNSTIPTIPYGTIVRVSTYDLGYNGLISFQGKILIDVTIHVIGDTTTSYDSYIKLQDVYIPSTRNIMEWIRLPYNPTSKNGIFINLNTT